MRQSQISNGQYIPSRTSKAETVGKIFAHGSPEDLPLLLGEEFGFIVVTFELLIFFRDIMPIGARTAFAAASAGTTSATLREETRSAHRKSQKSHGKDGHTFLPPLLPIVMV
jgi:hypothetical protein